MSYFLPLLLALTLFPSLSYAEQDSAQRLNDVKQEIRELTAQQKEKKAQRDELYAQLEAQSLKVSGLNRDLRDLEQQIQQQNEELDTLRTTMGITEQQQKTQFDALYAQIQAAFINAEPSYLELLLNQKDITTISRSSAYFRYFHKARKKQLDTLNDSLQRLNDDERELMLAQQSLEKLLAEQRQQQRELVYESDQRRTTLDELDSTINSNEARLAALYEEEENLQKLLNNLAQKQSSEPRPSSSADDDSPPSPGRDQPFSRLVGKLHWPIDGKVIANYGSSRNLGTLKWQGIVISSPTGHDVKASAAGKVVFAGWLRGFGLMIIIDHGEKYMTLYGNNESLLRDVGDQVQAGDVIAQSGERGIRDVTGLYFEIRHNGNPTNPSKWLGRQG